MNGSNHTEISKVEAWQQIPCPIVLRDSDGRSYFRMGTRQLWEFLIRVGQYFGLTNPYAIPEELEKYLADIPSYEPTSDGWLIKYLDQTAIDEVIHRFTPPDPEAKLAGVVPVSMLFRLYEILTKQTLPIEHPIREEDVKPDFNDPSLLPLIFDDLRVMKGMLEQIDITTRVNGHRIMMCS